MKFLYWLFRIDSLKYKDVEDLANSNSPSLILVIRLSLLEHRDKLFSRDQDKFKVLFNENTGDRF